MEQEQEQEDQPVQQGLHTQEDQDQAIAIVAMLARDAIACGKTQGYCCPRCDYKNAALAVFLKHLGRKNPCHVLPGREEVDPKEYALELKKARMSTKKFECVHCNKMYSTRSSVRVHIKKMHGDVVAADAAAVVAKAVAIAVEANVEANAEANAEAEATVTATAATAGDCQQEESPASAVRQFGHEDLDHLLGEDIHPRVKEIYCAAGTAEDKFQRVVRLVYNDVDRPDNKTVSFGAGGIASFPGGCAYLRVSDTEVVRMVKRRANAVLQHPLSQDDDALAAFEGEVGKDKVDDIKEFTYRLDMADEWPEFERETDSLVVSALVAAGTAQPNTSTA